MKEDPQFRKLKETCMMEFYRSAVEDPESNINPVEVLKDVIAGYEGVIAILASHIEVMNLLIASIEKEKDWKKKYSKRGK